jgi:hypothetical protein
MDFWCRSARTHRREKVRNEIIREEEVLGRTNLNLI